MRQKRKLKYYRICLLIIITALLLTVNYKIASHFLTIILNNPSENISSQSKPLTGSDYDINPLPDESKQITLDSSSVKLYSPYAILVRLKDSKVVFEINSERRIYPASLTKIMTAIVAIENISDIQEKVVLKESIFQDLYEDNASMAGFLPNEEVSAIDLLYGTLLPSGADAATGLAILTSDSESEFVNVMNKKAEQLGMNDTHFTNVSGLYDDNHYSTVKDIATLLEYALKNEIFREVFTSVTKTTASTNKHPDGIKFYSTMFKNMDNYEFEGGEILGGKTGYAGEETGLCLASLAVKNETEYISVTAAAAGNQYTEPYHIMDAFTLYGEYLKK